MEEATEAVLAEATAVPGSGVEVAQPRIPRCLQRGRSLVVGDGMVEIAERSASKAQLRDVDGARPQRANCGWIQLRKGLSRLPYRDVIAGTRCSLRLCSNHSAIRSRTSLLRSEKVTPCPTPGRIWRSDPGIALCSAVASSTGTVLSSSPWIRRTWRDDSRAATDSGASNPMLSTVARDASRLHSGWSCQSW